MLLFIFVGDVEDTIWVFMSLSLFEGQGRVIWGYNIAFRLMFDLLLGLAIIKGLTLSRRLINREIIPNYLLLGIIMHFIWWLLEIFNPSGPDLFSAFATSKYYVFPFFLFFFFQNFPLDLNSEQGQKRVQSMLVLLTLSAFLVIFQNFQGESLIYKISPAYANLTEKFKVFTGRNFRPWGTSFNPGGMSIFFYSALGFVFIYRPQVFGAKNTIKLTLSNLLRVGAIGAMLFASFVGQVRSATLKSVLILGIMFFLKFLGSRLKAKRSMTLVLILLGGFLVFPFLNIKLDNDSLGLSGTLNRWDGIDVNSLSSHRVGLDGALDRFEDRVELPFGYGLGMTQNFLPGYGERRKEHLDVPFFFFFHLDNLFFFLFLELGLGAFIYIYIMIALNISLLSRLITLLRWSEITAFAVAACSFSSVFVVTLFSWGAVSLPFNPESFYFWFWSALGFNSFIEVRRKRAKQVEDNDSNTNKENNENFENMSTMGDV